MADSTEPACAPPTLDEVRSRASARAIAEALERNRGRYVDAARELDVSRVTLYRLMLRYGLRKPEELAPARDSGP